VTDAVLALRDVVVRYSDAFAVRVPALDVGGGETLALIGPNGSGKSTLLRVMALLQAPAEGAVTFRGRPVTTASALETRRRMGVVFQQPLLADMRVEDNVELGLRFRGVASRDRRARVARWLARLGIGRLADQPARTLSGGEAQRVALARALVLEPDVLLLDEPFAALDALTREKLQDDLRRVSVETGRTSVFVTHSVDEAVFLGSRVVVLTPRPGQIALDLRIDLPRTGIAADELRGLPEFAALRSEIGHAIRDRVTT
jgi:taurine transport system ATP-binding protein